LAQAAEAASLVIEALGRDRSVFGAIHADMTFENVLATGNGLVIIDFDDFGEGWFGFDIATALFFATPHPNFAILAEAFLRGYESVRELDPAVGGALDAFLIARGMSYLGWAADRPGDPASDFAESRLAPWVVEAAKRFTGSGSTGWLHQDNSSTPQGEI
jgi:Ser/Thr protein kinase RdoA (MazF antagonist)